MPNRIIKESICTSENIDALTAFQETFFYRLIVNCDDFGRFDGRPEILSARLYPLKVRTIKLSQVQEALNALAKAGLVVLYEHEGKPYIQIAKWTDHQQVRNKRSKYPAPDGECAQLISIDSKCPRNPIQSESNPYPNTDSTAKAAPRPSLEEVREYCRERGNRVDPEAWYDHYTSNGWKIGGRSPMKDWKACVRNWERNGYGNARAAPQNPALNYQHGGIDYEALDRIGKDFWKDDENGA